MEKLINQNRIMISATGSSVGKTTITIGLLLALKEKGIKLHAFKSGPDYIDPMYHRSVLGVNSKNLDPFFCDKDMLRASFLDCAENDQNGLNIIEGAMGLYDGIGTTSTASSYETASALNCPIIVVVNSRGVGYSVIPIIKGFLSEDNNKLIKGIILNNISKQYYEKIKIEIENKCNIPVVGFLPVNNDISLKSRHLGLMSPMENDINEKLIICKNLVLENFDLNKILEISSSADSVRAEMLLSDYINDSLKKACKKPLLIRSECGAEESFVIAVAKDEAFSFYYEDNLKALKMLGAKIVYFSPLNDKKLPENTSGIIIGGGYPELYEDKLKENIALTNELKSSIERGIPVLAECGGFMYLFYNGIFEGEVTYEGKSVRFGYINILNEKYNLKGHEFHHYDVSNKGEYFDINPANGKAPYKAVISYKNVLAGFPHLYYFSDISFVRDFVRKAIEYKNDK